MKILRSDGKDATSASLDSETNPAGPGTPEAPGIPSAPGGPENKDERCLTQSLNVNARYL